MTVRGSLRQAAAALVAAVALVAPAAAPAIIPDPVLPEVAMGRVVLAATLDPWRIDEVKTPGASDDVILVERALHARGYLDAVWVDGYFGQSTIRAWGRYEHARGQTSRATANGLPGLEELRDLGAGRFRLTNVVDVGDVVTLKSVAAGGQSDDGHDKVNQRTRAMFLEAQRVMAAAGQTGRDMVIVQGGYCFPGCAADSAGVHNGGGAIDIRTWDTTSTGNDNRVAALRKVGFAAWERGEPAFSPHIHAVAINDYQLSWEAHGDGIAFAPLVSDFGGNCQIYEFKFFNDGLHGCDDRVASTSDQRAFTTWEQYLAGQ